MDLPSLQSWSNLARLSKKYTAILRTSQIRYAGMPNDFQPNCSGAVSLWTIEH